MIVETENLTKRFRRTEAVRGVNLSVPEGAAFALIGANGAGKTTALRLLVNLLRPDAGSARVLGVDSRHLGPRNFMDIGYVSENQQIPDGLTVDQFLVYLRSLYANWDAALEVDLRRFFDLPGAQSIGKLSHGTRMKVKLIAALAFRPKLLILDEPLSGLDPLVRDEVMAGILRQAGETTIVISSHEVTEIEACVTHVAFMAKGKIVLQESMETLGARFREVIATSSRPIVASQLPDAWLVPEAHGSTLRFVHSAHRDDDELRNSLNAQFGLITHFESKPMSLRDVAKSLLRVSRTESMR